jgi:rhodanese-related sulfurtransferase
MTRFKQYHIWSIIILLTAGYNLCFAITANELKGLMEQNAQITIIDARSRSAFAQGHILNAINIPCDILKNKPLPPIGNVVVYGDGLKKKDIQTAVDALNGQQGIDADILKGGYPVWVDQNNDRIPQFGIKKDMFASITYQVLKKADEAADQDITIVDLRYTSYNNGSGKKKPNTTQIDKDLTNLSEIFPALNIIKPDVQFSKGVGTNSTGTVSGLSGISKKQGFHLYVLIDMGDGTSQKITRRLKAKGITQTAILIGGEKIVKRKGEPGTGSTVTEF